MRRRSGHVASLCNGFLADLDRLNRLYYSIQELRPTSKFASKPITWRQAGELSEGVFMKMFVLWEDYQERLFLAYLLGKKQPNGQAIPRHFHPLDSSHAQLAVLQGKDFANWTSPDVVVERANLLLLDGGPFRIPLVARSTELQELKTVRNAIAHNSGSARTKFEKLVRVRLTFLPAGTTPGSYLAATLPNKTEIQWERYLELVRSTGKALVP